MASKSQRPPRCDLTVEPWPASAGFFAPFDLVHYVYQVLMTVPLRTRRLGAPAREGSQRTDGAKPYLIRSANTRTPSNRRCLVERVHVVYAVSVKCASVVLDVKKPV
jgi:hypothetical protein